MSNQTPNWNNAPQWAQYWAVDPDMVAYWHQNKPAATFDILGDGSGVDGWYCDDTVSVRFQVDVVLKNVPDWTKTLQQRPTNALPANEPTIEKKIEDWALGVRCENNQIECKAKEWDQSFAVAYHDKPTEFFKVTKGRNYLTGWPDTGF